MNFFSIESMGSNDLDEVLEIENESFVTPWKRRLFEEELNNPSSRIFLYKDEEGKEHTVIGYICLWLVRDEVHILKIAVRPYARRKGIALKLLQHALDYSYRKKIVKAVLEVRESNFSARCFYQKCGFLLIGVRPRYYQDTNENALIMELDLNTFTKRHAREENEACKTQTV